MIQKILIVEDEAKIARFLELELKHEGYGVEIATDGIVGYEKAISNPYDLIILDLMLPHMSGIEVCRRVRRELEVPIIMLTAKDDIPDKVMGLDSGANDYVTKPFAIEELLARIRALLKRKQPKSISVGKLTIEPEKYLVSFDSEEISMTNKEIKLLEYLMINKEVALSRDMIIEKVWGYDYSGETNIVDVYIRYLRTKIDDRFGVKYIQTVRGVGYKFKYET